MRINPINVGLTTKVNKSRSKISTDPTLQQPIATDKVQFKANNSYLSSLKSIVDANQHLRFYPEKSARFSNHAKIKGMFTALYECIKPLPAIYKDSRADIVAEDYLKLGHYNSIGSLSPLFNLKTGEVLELVKDPIRGDVYCALKNFGPYSFNKSVTNYPQSMLFFINPDKDDYIAFSNNNRGGLAYITRNSGRHEFYAVHQEEGLPYWNHSYEFEEPLSFTEYYNKDGSENKLQKFLNALRW